MKRNCIYLKNWPVAEKLAFERAVATSGLFATAPAADWAPSIRDRYIRGYGTWLHYLAQLGGIRTDVRPSERVSAEQLRAFILHLQNDGLAPVTVSLTLRGLLKILETVDPGPHLRDLVKLVRRWQMHAKPRRDKTKVLVGASAIYEAGRDLMLKLLNSPATEFDDNEYMDGLLICLIISCPLRLSTVVGMLTSDLTRARSDAFVLRVEKARIKNRHSVVCDLPPSLTPFIDHWLSECRPRLMGARTHAAFWVSSIGTPASRSTIYKRLGDVTELKLHVRLHPHAFRYVAPTSIAVSMPGKVEIAPLVLGNNAKTCKEYYDVSSGLAASFDYVRTLSARKARR